MRKVVLVCICPLLVAYSQPSFSQRSTTVSGAATSVDSSRIDTNYIKSYKNRLIVALWWSGRKFDISINQKLFSPNDKSGINYIANANNVAGISLDYDILGFAFGYRSIPGGNERTGSTDYLDVGFNVNTRGLRFENSFKRYTGFYDKNSANYIVPFDSATHYFQTPNLNLQIIKTKLIYTFNKRKFTLSASYANVKRQVRSKGSWIIIANFYALNMYSLNSFIPPLLQPSYGPVWDGLNRMNVYAYSAGFGGSYTLVVFKRFYLNMLGSFGPETQYRHFYVTPENVHYKYWKTWLASDFRVAFGYNGKKFFARLSGIYDITSYDSNDMKFGMTFYSGSFDLGYRFKFKAPKPYRKFQETAIYKKL